MSAVCGRKKSPRNYFLGKGKQMPTFVMTINSKLGDFPAARDGDIIVGVPNTNFLCIGRRCRLEFSDCTVVGNLARVFRSDCRTGITSYVLHVDRIDLR